MLSFEVSAIDLILVIAVSVLLLLYMTKIANGHVSVQEQIFKRPVVKDVSREMVEPKPQRDHVKCPRGFGNLKLVGADGSVSDRCLGCYRIMECYGESEESRF